MMQNILLQAIKKYKICKIKKKLFKKNLGNYSLKTRNIVEISK